MVVSLALAVLSVGLSLLAGYLLREKNKNLVQDDKPTTLATRGSFLPWVRGRRRIGAIFGWAGVRSVVEEKAGGGKGGLFSGPKVKIYYESGWHLLCVGPVKALHEIEQGGKILFAGPINQFSHPSGSTIDLGSEGSFQIYWGEPDQPVNAYLGDSGRVGVSSRWPNACYIQWTRKRLGQQPNWPLLTYVVEVEPQGSHLSDTEPFVPPTYTLPVDPSEDAEDIWQRTNGAEDTGRFTFRGDYAHVFKNGGRVRLTGNALPDQDFDVKRVVTRLVFYSFDWETWTDVYPVGGLTGADATGQLQSYTAEPNDGYNPAHILADLWFSPWPHGIGASTSLFDVDSLEDLGTLCETEDLRCSVIAKDGETMRGLLAGVYQDLGVLMPINFRTGLLQFVPVREPSGILPDIVEDLQIELPETEVRHGPNPVDRLLFSFSDRENRYRDMTVGIDDYGQASYEEFHRARTVQIISTVTYDTANTIAERRSQEELAGGSEFKVVSNRGAKLLLPGQAITIEGIPEIARLTAVDVDPLSGRTTLTCIPDAYGVTKSTFVQDKAKTVGDLLQVQPDIAFRPFEVPEILLDGQAQTVVVARIRAHQQIDGADIHISRDDSTFVNIGEDATIMQGGTLDTAIAADDLFNQAEGPTITALGDDVAAVLDLSADTTSWRNGRQIAVINGEIFYLKTITSLGGGQYRLDGLIRARYDTRAQAHAIGSIVYIAQNDDGLAVQDVLLEPQVTLYTKSQPKGNGVMALGAIASESTSLYGKGVRPVPISNLSLDISSGGNGIGRHSYVDGDLTIRWSYSTPQSVGTGAGQFGAGVPQGAAAPEGDFLVEILTSGDVLVRSTTVSTNSYAYTDANRTADFGGEPSSFRARVTQLRNGQSSDPVTQTIERVT